MNDADEAGEGVHMIAPRFGFRVHYEESYHPDDTAGWIVRLPHQCDAWTIAPGDAYDAPVPHAEAISRFEAFIAEAQEALAALREQKEYGDD